MPIIDFPAQPAGPDCAALKDYLAKRLAAQPKSLVVLLGPTAVGKTALSLQLTQLFPLEIVSLDSRQVYRGLDIGTAKPTPAEQALVPHHLLDLVDPQTEFNLAHYLAAASKAITTIRRRGKIPLLTGGSVLHIDALLSEYDLAQVAPSPKLRQELYQQIKTGGSLALHQRLAELDPVAAANIHPHNLPRLVRALEVCLLTGQPFSRLKKSAAADPAADRHPVTDKQSVTSKHPKAGRPSVTLPTGPRSPTGPHSPTASPIIYLGLIRPRGELYRRINQRVQEMIAAGLVAEVQHLLKNGVPPTAPSMTSHGYRHICQYLAGKATLPETIRTIERDTRHYAKRQLTWWRRNPEIVWFDLSKV